MSTENHKKDKASNLSNKLSHNKLSHNKNIEKIISHRFQFSVLLYIETWK